MVREPCVWIGLLEVKRLPITEILSEDEIGAYTQALALTTNRLDFHNQIFKAVQYLKLEFVSLDESEPLDERLQRNPSEPIILELAEEVRNTGDPRFSTWHTYEDE